MARPGWFEALPKYEPPKGFAEWMAKVDAIIAARTGGLTSSDLPDFMYADEFADGATPKGAATRAIKAAREF